MDFSTANELILEIFEAVLHMVTLILCNGNYIECGSRVIVPGLLPGVSG